MQDTKCSQRIIDDHQLEIERLRLLSLAEQDSGSGAVIGVVIAAVILVVAVAAAVVYVFYKRH